MRLTADVIIHARASINPCDERELDLRGYKIPMIENLGVTQDQFDAMDFSDNEIKKLENFPRYKRLSSLLFCNNHISKISEELGACLPGLSCLILTNNKLSSLAELKGLGSCTKLTILSLLHNEVVNKQYYRLYVINLVPSLKQLDFQKVTIKERESAARLAQSQAGQTMMQDVAKQAEKAKTFVPGAPAAEEQKLTEEHRAIYADRIAKATTVEEIEMLSKKIQAGIIPSANYKQGGGGGVPVENGAAAVAVPAAAATAAAAAGKATGASAPSAGVEAEAAPPAAAPQAPAAAATSSMDVDDEAVAVAGAEAGAGQAAVMGAGGGEDDAGGGDARQEEAPPAAEGGSEKEEEAISATKGDGDDAAMVVDEGGQEEREEKEGEAEAAAGEAVAVAAVAATPEEEGTGDMEQEQEQEAEEEEAEAEEPKLSVTEIKSYKVADLKKALVERGLPTGGLKADLAARLMEAEGH